MIHTTVGVLSLLLTLGGARADMQTPPAEPAPRLQISRLSGRLEIESGKRADEDASRMLPLLRPGSTVRVVSGYAVFDSDYHVTVRAVEGDSFRFTAIQPEGSRSGALLIAAVDRAPKALEVSVGDQKFRLRRGSAISISAAWPGELTVRSEGGGVRFAPGSLAKNGSMLSVARRMAPGEAVTVAVPEAPAFENAAIDPARLSVSRGKDAAFFVASGRPLETALRHRDAEARRVISVWPVVSQRTADVIMEKYGPPDLAISDRLVWYDNGAWKITTVYRDPREHQDVLEQTIGYTVPEDKIAALARLDVGLRLSRDRRALSAVSEAEETNILALNLADEVVREKSSAEDARAFYLKTVVQWNAGKSSRYMKELLFR